ncbi:hypothetical protein [Nocardia sp. bgisy134]|uniref:hypothetical protein n=1 Tax=Nocardia sp. bgisy134 TaxID=3413789 RepID=UPI003D73303C
MAQRGRPNTAAMIIDKLRQAIAVEGYVLYATFEVGDGQRGSPAAHKVWFVNDGIGIPGMTKGAIEALVVDDPSSEGVRISGYAYLLSDAVAEVVKQLPVTALDSSYKPAEYLNFNYLQMVGFGSLDTPRKIDRTFHMFDVGGDGVDEFVRYVRGKVRDWFDQRISVDQLLIVAREPTHQDRFNPSPRLLRGVAVLAVLSGRPRQAVELLGWYLDREKVGRLDSIDRATLFEQELGNLLPDYSAAKGSN